MSGFEIVVAQEGDRVVGSAHGVTLPVDVKWREGARHAAPCSLVEASDDGRVFWLRELMVRPPYRSKGLGRELHDELVSGRSEDWVAMTVIIDNEPARSAYLKWGYEIFTRIRHAPESPLYDAMSRLIKFT